MFHKSGDAQSSVKSSTFINRAMITQEPRASLSRFLLSADAALQHKGVTLSFATFDEFRSVHQMNSKTWPVLLPFFDAEVSEINPNTAACFVARNEEGEAVSATAVRVWDLGGTNLRDEIESLRFFYGNRAKDWKDRATCEITAPVASTFDGHALYCGAYWVRPDYRGHGLTALVPAMSRYYALGRWPVDYKISFGAKAFLAPELRDIYQYEDCEGDFRFTVDGQLRVNNYLLMWARASYMLDQLPSLTKKLDAASASSFSRHAEHPTIRP
jgi:hypothetical protein